MELTNLAWVIWLLPLAAAAVITLFTQRAPRLSAALSIGAIGMGFALSVWLFSGADRAQVVQSAVPWLNVGQFQADLGIQLDALSLLMLLVVTGVGSAIHIYSYGYMHRDPGFSRYFASLSLFTFSMLGIVLANNFILLFVCWELVGLSSYLLIGFWYERPAAADAAKKAFLTNRLGDFGFLIGILLLWELAGSVQYTAIQAQLAANPALLGAWAGVAGLLIFCGAMGKSAQFPLHVWLPDAMEGPTPVSALIHAATMVAAGVYMLCRVFFVYQVPSVWPEGMAWMTGISALDVIAWVGGITALLSGLIAVQQSDLKRILAYSTLSQLGYMIMAVGLEGPSPAMFHLSTHAFFKALLFLGAGSVILALHHEQDIWRMGGLRRRMPITFATFLIGTLALCGVPPFSGFYSKDAILAQAFHHSVALFVLGVVVSMLTTFYMFRLLLVVFLGPEKGEAASHAHESPRVITWPLLVLAVFSALGGIIGIDRLLERVFPSAGGGHAPAWDEVLFAPFSHAPAAALFGLLATIAGFTLAWVMYGSAMKDPFPLRFPRLSRTLRNRFYFDELYAALISVSHEALARLADWWDRWVIAGLGVRGAHGTTELTGRALRLLQTGNLQTYAFLFAAGVALVLWWTLS